jgi:hypothetical protein
MKLTLPVIVFAAALVTHLQCLAQNTTNRTPTSNGTNREAILRDWRELAPTWPNRERRQKIKQLMKPGMTKTDVLSVAGKPDSDLMQLTCLSTNLDQTSAFCYPIHRDPIQPIYFFVSFDVSNRVTDVGANQTGYMDVAR